MRSTKKKPKGAKLRSWRGSILHQQAHNLGTIEGAGSESG
jgi:hypothetical protein